MKKKKIPPFWLCSNISFQGLFLTATNNVIWSLATGVRRSQDDPLTIDLTARVVKIFEDMSPSNLLALFMINSATYCKILRFFGFRNTLSSKEAIVNMIEDTIEQSSAEPNGNYIERGLAEIERSGDDNKSTFNKKTGKGYLTTQLLEMFIAGEL